MALLHSHCCRLGSPGQQGSQMSVLSNQHCISSVILKPSSATSTFVDKLTTMWPDMSSNPGIVRLFLASRDLAAVRPYVTPDTCVTTAYTAAHTPCVRAADSNFFFSNSNSSACAPPGNEVKVNR